MYTRVTQSNEDGESLADGGKEVKGVFHKNTFDLTIFKICINILLDSSCLKSISFRQQQDSNKVKMKHPVIKLGTVCTDEATKLTGTLTHWLIGMSGSIDYLFQPNGLNPETCQPVKKIILSPKRLILPPNAMKEIEIPFEILGTQVEDQASGFKGMAIALIMHINGCFHVEIQPPGVTPKDQTPIKTAEFDLRGCTGIEIPVLTEAEQEKSQREKPSPDMDYPRQSDREIT